MHCNWIKRIFRIYWLREHLADAQWHINLSISLNPGLKYSELWSAATTHEAGQLVTSQRCQPRRILLKRKGKNVWFSDVWLLISFLAWKWKLKLKKTGFKCHHTNPILPVIIVNCDLPKQRIFNHIKMTQEPSNCLSEHNLLNPWNCQRIW